MPKLGDRAQSPGTTVFQANANDVTFEPSPIGLSVHYPRILKPPLISRYQKIYNVHPGYLPYGRGFYPVFWALWQDTPAGATFHEINAGIDEGAIVSQTRVEYTEADTGGSLHARVRARRSKSCSWLRGKSYRAVKRSSHSRRRKPGETYHHASRVFRAQTTRGVALVQRNTVGQTGPLSHVSRLFGSGNRTRHTTFSFAAAGNRVNPMLKESLDQLALFGGSPAFEQALHVGRPNIGDRTRLLERINHILDERWLTNTGPYVQEFEDRIARLVGAKHCIAMCNATVALEIAIRALGMTGEVIVPSMTFIATPHALQWQQITPIFCDIDPITFTLDPKRVQELITPRTTGIIGVHLWGRSCDTDAITEIARGAQPARSV